MPRYSNICPLDPPQKLRSEKQTDIVVLDRHGHLGPYSRTIIVKISLILNQVRIVVAK